MGEKHAASSEDTIGAGHSADAAGMAARAQEKEARLHETGKRELKEEDCESELGYAYPSWKKWWILSVIFIVQVSMNFNTSLYSNGLVGMSEEFGVSLQACRAGAAIYLITYGFGCELWAPWSEEFGRKPILQLSLLFTNIFIIPVAIAPNFASIMVGRALGGLATAGGSVTLGMVADMYDADSQQYAVAFIVFSSVGGSILGPIVGGFCEQYLEWRWCMWIQLIFGGFVQLLHLLTVPETRTSVMMNRIAKNRRKTGQDPNIYGPDEIESFRERFTWSELFHTMFRPFRMFLTEPIVLTLSLLSGFSDAIIFMFIQSFAIVFEKWHFSPSQIGLSFVAIGLGYLAGYLIFIPSFSMTAKKRAQNPNDEHVQYESRMTLLLWTAPALPIGLLIFAWTSGGPPLHWMGVMVGAAVVGIANYSIYMATIDYMVAAYGPYSASATGGNGWARDFLAGVLTVPATPFYTNIGAEKGMNTQYASMILFCISVILVAACFWVYFKGPELRKRSPFAQSLANGTAEFNGRRVSIAASARRGSHPERPGGGMRYESRRGSYMASHNAASRRSSKQASRANSRANSIDHGHQNLEAITSIPTRQ